MMPPAYFVWIAVTIAACVCTCYVAMHVAVQHLLSSQYSLLPQTQHDSVNPVGIGGKGCDLSGLVGGLFSREALAAPDKLAAAEAADVEAASRGGSFSGSLLQGGMRRQGSMHMRSDSANGESVHVSPQNSPRSEVTTDGGPASGVSPFSIAGARARQDW